MIVCDYIDENVKNYLRDKSNRKIITFFKEPFNSYRGNEIIFIDDVLDEEDYKKINDYVEKKAKIIKEIFSKYLEIEGYNLFNYNNPLGIKGKLCKTYKYKYSIDKITKNNKSIYLNFFSTELVLFELLKRDYLVRNRNRNSKILRIKGKIKSYINYSIFMNYILDWVFTKPFNKDHKKLKNIVWMGGRTLYSQLLNELEKENNIFLLQNDMRNNIKFLKKNYKFYSLKIKNYIKFNTKWNNIKRLYRKGLCEIASIFNVKIKLLESIIGFNENLLKYYLSCLTILQENKCDMDFLYVEQSVSGIQPLGIDFFNRNKLPSIEVLHGIAAVVEHGKTTKVAVYGRRDKLFLSNYGVDKSKIIATGCPYCDRIFSIKKEKQYNFLLLILDWVGFFPSSNSYDEIFKQVIEMIKLLRFFKNEDLIIKLHPGQNKKELEYICHLVNNFKEVRGRIKVKKDEDIIDLLRNSKIVYTFWSSVGVEALLMKKPLIILDYILSYWRPIDYEKYGGCLVAKNYEELILATEEILKDVHGYLKKNNENIEKTRRYFSGDLKGESYKNVTRAINEILYK